MCTKKSVGNENEEILLWKEYYEKQENERKKKEKKNIKVTQEQCILLFKI